MPPIAIAGSTRSTPSIVIRDGKTGRQIYNDSGHRQALDAVPGRAAAVRLRPEIPGRQEERRQCAAGGGQLFQFEHSGEDLPFFHHHIVGLNQLPQRSSLHAARSQPGGRQAIAQGSVVGTVDEDSVSSADGSPVSTGDGSEKPRHDDARHRQECQQQYQSERPLPLLHGRALDRIAAGPPRFGIDPVNHRVLWEKISEGPGPLPSNSSHPGSPSWRGLAAVDPRDGTVLLTYDNNWAQRLGQVGPFQGQTICVQSFDHLASIRSPAGPYGRAWMSIGATTSSPTRITCSSSSWTIRIAQFDTRFPCRRRQQGQGSDFAALFAKRLQVFGRYLLVSESGPITTWCIRLYDVVSGQDVWKQSFPAQSLVARSEDATLTSVVEPSGKVHVIDLRTQGSDGRRDQ